MAVTCLVDECAADLTDCRKYYQRHKVCEIHSKSPHVSINGQNLRFCQQCSRFHSLDEFDEGKRSCRKRLDGHNKRRRKPRQHDLFPPNHGSNLLQFAGQQVHPTMNPLWSGVVESPALVDQLNYAPSLLSSPVAPPQASSSTLSHVVQVVQPLSNSGSVSIAASPLDQEPSYVGLESDCDVDWGGMTDMDPQTLHFYWQS